MSMPNQSNRLLATICALLLTALTLACGSGNAVTSATKSNTTPVVQTAVVATNDKEAATSAPTAAPTEVPTISGASRAAPLALTTPLYFTTWAITVTDVLRDEVAATAIADANQFNEPAPEGMRYLIANVQIQNIGTDAEAKSTMLAVSLRVTGDQALLYGPASVVTPKPIEGDLFPGGATAGQIAFLVPDDETNLMFRVAEGLSFDSDAQRYLAIDTGAVLVPDAALKEIAATEAGRTKDQPAELGDTVTTDEWQVTVLEVARGKQAAQLAAEANQFNEPAAAGQEYIAIKVRARYLGGDTPDTAADINRLAFKLTGAKRVVYELPSVVGPSPDLDATLYAGATTEGWAIMSAEANEQGLVIIYEPPFSFDSAGTRYLGIE